jgi:co-chaperonin GroES (HSP10)
MDSSTSIKRVENFEFKIADYYLIVKYMTNEGKTASGLYVAEPTGLPKYIGLVEQIGDKVNTVVVGDFVLFQKHAGQPLYDKDGLPNGSYIISENDLDAKVVIKE